MKCLHLIAGVGFIFLGSCGTVQPMFNFCARSFLQANKKPPSSMFKKLSFDKKVELNFAKPINFKGSKASDLNYFNQSYRPNYMQRQWFQTTSNSLLSDEAMLIEQQEDEYALRNIELYELQCRIANRLNCSMLDAGRIVYNLSMANEWIEIVDLSANIKDVLNEWSSEKIEKKFKYLNQQDKDGETPLFYVVRVKNYPAVRVYLKLGSDPNIPDFSGRTALSIAQEHNDEYLINKLLKYGAIPDVAC